MNLEGKKMKMLISMTKLVNKKHFVVRYSVLNRYQIHCNCAIINVDFAISLFDCARWYSYQYDGLKLQHLTYTLVTFSKNTMKFYTIHDTNNYRTTVHYLFRDVFH